MMRVRCSTRINGLPGGNVADCFDAVVCTMSDLLRNGMPSLANLSELFGFVTQSMPYVRRPVISPRAERDQPAG